MRRASSWFFAVQVMASSRTSSVSRNICRAGDGHHQNPSCNPPSERSELTASEASLSGSFAINALNLSAIALIAGQPVRGALTLNCFDRLGPPLTLGGVLPAVTLVKGFEVRVVVLVGLDLIHRVSALQHGLYSATTGGGILKRRNDLPMLVFNEINFHRSSSYTPSLSKWPLINTLTGFANWSTAVSVML
jgi:hypothetical protein